MRKNKALDTQDFPLKMVGSTAFGRYPKISVEQTFNMIESDGWLVPFAGYKKVLTISAKGKGRGIFNSARANKLILVVDNGVYSIDSGISSSKIATIQTYSGDVFMDENDKSQIGICDKSNIYVYDYSDGTFEKAETPDFRPGYLTFQDGYLISSDLNNPAWRLSDPNDATSWPSTSNSIGTFQTKASNTVACVRLPGKGNALFVFGSTVTEAWNDVGYQLFPYQRSSSFNIDYGCLNQATIASGDRFVIWLGSNEKSGPVILYSDGGEAIPLSEVDGINFRLANLSHPEKSYGSLFEQDGHIFYMITFYDPADNLSLAYDFKTKGFYTLTDESMNYHIAKKIVFFNGRYYFISINDGNLYELSSDYTTIDYGNGLINEIPRIRIPPPITQPNRDPFIVSSVSFPIEMGQNKEDAKVYLSISNDGGESFGNNVDMKLNAFGKRKNRFIFWNCGYTNEFTPQFRFYGKNRFVVSNGIVSAYQ